MNRLHRILRGRPVSNPIAELKARPYRLITAYWLVRAFYLFIFFDAFYMVRRLHRITLIELTPDPLWVISWIDRVDIEASIRLLGFGFIFCAFLVMIWPSNRSLKLTVAFFAVSVFALENSYGALNHSHYYLLWLSIVFTLLPSGDLSTLQSNRVRRECFLSVFFLAQFSIALFYTLSGIYKVHIGIFFDPTYVSNFASDALPRHIIKRWMDTGEIVFFEEFFANNLWMGWPVFIGVMYIEIVAVIAVFRPQLHFIFGCLFALFHLSIWFFMNISFPYQPTVVVLLFVWSPFSPETRTSFKEIFLQLPIIGDAVRGIQILLLKLRRPKLAKELA